ncbi:MAG: hypothetical protein QN229_03730 [Desulfurococcaceae archaeon TW002]
MLGLGFLLRIVVLFFPLARALVKKLKLLVADEPFLNLDEITTLILETGSAVLITATDLNTDYGIGTSKFLVGGKLI